MLPLSSSGMFRPSSQIAESLASAVGTKDRKPCCRFFPSRWGTTGLLQLVPLSFENAMLMSYASESGPPLITSQWAARVPSDRTDIEGKSAGLANQFAPRAIVFGADHPCGPRTERRRTCPLGAVGSSQLIYTRPSDATARLGSPLPGAAGVLISGTAGAAGLGVPRSMAAAARMTKVPAILIMAKEFMGLRQPAARSYGRLTKNSENLQ